MRRMEFNKKIKKFDIPAANTVSLVGRIYKKVRPVHKKQEKP
jgi:hypothetical protein